MVRKKVFALSLRRVTALGALWASKGTISGLQLCWNNSQKSLHRLATSPTAASAWPVIATLPPFPLPCPLSTFHPLCYQALGLGIAHDPSRLHRPKRFRGGLKDRVSRCVEVETALPFDS